MFKLYLGKSGTGKSNEIYADIKRAVLEKSAVTLLVPEQFEFEAEKLVYKKGGAGAFRYVSVTTFTKLSTQILRYYKSEGVSATDAEKSIAMHKTLRETALFLSYYEKSAGKPALVPVMLEAVSAFKQSGITAASLEKALAEKTLSDSVERKALDLLLIYRAYCANLEKIGTDRLDDTARAAALAEQNCFFGGKILLADGFSGFSGSQLLLLQAMLKQAQSLTLSLPYSDENDLIFAPQKSLVTRLSAFAAENEVEVKTTIFDKPLRFKNKGLASVSESLFQSGNGGENPDGITVCRCDDRYAEAEYVAASIRRLVMEEKLRFRDIAVVSRDTEGYISAIRGAFEKYEIPAFYDVPNPISEKPLVRLILTFLDNACRITTEGLFRYAKSGFVRLCKDGEKKPISFFDINALEEFAYTWGIRDADWLSPFPGEKNAEIEALRRELVEPVIAFKKRVSGLDGAEITAELSRFLIDELDIGTSILAHCKRAGDENLVLDKELSAEYRQLWELVVSTLESLHNALCGYPMSLNEYLVMLGEIFAKTTMARPPQVMDAVLFGNASRSRLSDVKAVFVVGLNSGLFPMSDSQNSLFSGRELEELADVGIRLGDTPLERYSTEILAAYQAVCAASERVFATYPLVGTGGEPLLPSSAIEELNRLFPTLTEVRAATLGEEFYAVSRQAAKQRLARIFRAKNAPMRSELIAALKESDADYINGLEAVVYASRSGSNRHDVSPLYMERIFSENRISATRLESLSKCSFQYFCRFGLGVQTVYSKDLSGLEVGNIIHYVLQKILESYNPDYDSFIAAGDDVLAEKIRFFLDEYKRLFLLSGFAKGKRFDFLYKGLEQTLLRLLNGFKVEFGASGFRPKFFELFIGDSKNEIKDGLSTLPFKISLKAREMDVYGKLDRLDVLEDGENRYVRIIDYKTGKREFSLPVVFYGLDTQMLMYLFAISDSNPAVKPAGVLYYPSGTESFCLADRDYTDKDREKSWLTTHRKTGIILDESVVSTDKERLEAKLRELSGAARAQFIKAEPLSEKEILSLKELCREKTAESLEKLLSGEIRAVPVVAKGQNPCDSCEFRDFCGRGADEIAVSTDAAEKFKNGGGKDEVDG